MKPVIEVELALIVAELELSLLEVGLERQNYFGVEGVSLAESVVVIDAEFDPESVLAEVLAGLDLEMGLWVP